MESIFRNFACALLITCQAPGIRAQETPGQPPSTQQPSPSGQPAPQQQTIRQEPAAGQPASEGPRNISDGSFSLDVFYWLTGARPQLRGSITTTTSTTVGLTTKTTTTTTPSNLAFPGKSEPARDATLSIPAGRYNALRFSYFQTRGGGNTTATQNTNLFGAVYNAGDFLTAHYTLQNAKVSWDYLSYRLPPRATGFRVKTLWEIQYTWLRSSISAPEKTPSVDSSGNLITNSSTGTRSLIFPTLGAGLEHAVSKNFRWEAKASGFGIPHHGNIWDTEAWAAYRFGQLEARAGIKAFHFKTSPKNDIYVGGATLSGAFFDVRWYPKL